jgi:hypothetical protein
MADRLTLSASPHCLHLAQTAQEMRLITISLFLHLVPVTETCLSIPCIEMLVSSGSVIPYVRYHVIILYKMETSCIILK